MAGFVIRGLEISGSATRVLVTSNYKIISVLFPGCNYVQYMLCFQIQARLPFFVDSAETLPLQERYLHFKFSGEM